MAEKFRSVTEMLPEKYHEIFVKSALDHWKQASASARRQLEKTLREHVVVKGFRDPSKGCPAALLYPEVTRHLKACSHLFFALLQVWLESQEDLANELGAFLDSYQKSLQPGTTEGSDQEWTESDIDQLAFAFVKDHSGFSCEDVVLMLHCLTRNLIEAHEPVMTEERSSEAGEAGDQNEELDLANWLEQLENLSADSAQWELIEAFLETARAIADSKREERTNTAVKLRNRLSQLLEKHGEEVEFFSFKDVTGWKEDACPSDQRLSATRYISELMELFDQHCKSRQKKTSSLAEDRQRRQKLDNLEHQIAEKYNQLNSLFKAKSEDRLSQAAAGVTDKTSPAEGVSESASPSPEIPAAEKADPGRSEALTEEKSSVREQETPQLLAESKKLIAEEERGILEEVSPLKERQDERKAVAIQLESTRTAKEIAGLLQQEERAEYWEALVWALLAEEDVPAAFWLSKSLEKSKEISTVPHWLLAALQGAEWLQSESDLFVIDLLEISRRHTPAGDHTHEFLALAAAMRPALIAPATGMINWLLVPDCCPSLNTMVGALREFASYGKALRPEELLGISGSEELEREIQKISDQARQWLEDAPKRRRKMKRALDVWLRLVSPQGDLGALLQPVCRDEREKVNQVYALLENSQERDRIIDRINEIDRRTFGRKGPEIVAAAREQIIRDVREAHTLARRWCDLVEKQKSIESRGDWLAEQVAKLRRAIQDCRSETDLSLEELCYSSQPFAVRAAALSLRRAVNQLYETLSIQPAAQSQNKWQWLTEDASDLKSALSRRLLWLPNIELDDSGFPPEDDFSKIPEELVNSLIEARNLRAAFEEWLQVQDYRCSQILLKALKYHEDLPSLSRQCQQALDASINTLKGYISEIQSVIEQAVVDGIIVEERSEYSAVVERIAPEKTLNFRLHYASLKQVRDLLERKREQRLRELRNEWQSVCAQLSQETEQWKRIKTFVESALQRRDTRVVEECVAKLTESIATGIQLQEEWFMSLSDSRDFLSEFLDRSTQIETVLEKSGLTSIAQEIQRGRGRFGELPTPRQKEAVEAIEAWRQLKKSGSEGRGQLRPVQVLLRFLGFNFQDTAEQTIQIRKRGTDWLHVQALMSAGDLAKPIPQFGSETRGQYDVVCVWERPGVDTLSSWLKDLRLHTHSVIILYFGRLTAKQRHDLNRRVRTHDLAIAILDETLLIFLTKERDARLPAFLRTALPFASVRPFTPFRAGDVPPEIFYGRESMARELLDPSGSCILYGGRQLGKSALLRHVQREFHFPEREQYAWVDDIKLLGTPQSGQPPQRLWEKLREGFKSLNLMSARITTNKPDDIIRYIKDSMKEPKRRVMVLFDEADNFLDTDAKEGFATVEALRTLILESQRRFKIVFAGLHNVQRFQGIPNQPLAHFGRAILVGPLEPQAARQLIRDPFEVLGYRFSDDSVVLKILSYTNYHPGLIQFFCQELLKQLQTKARSSLPPYSITQRDVEAVYRMEDVRRTIRERLEWTVALDMRYQAIAWSMIVDQTETRNGYAEAYTAGEILEMTRLWWTQGFNDVSEDELRGLLDEMSGLGILVANVGGRYRMRSPNLVRLMGPEEDVENRLLELAEKQPPVVFDADRYHAPVDPRARRYSPFTYAQARRLNPQKFGVGLIFATEALGLSCLEDTLKGFISVEVPEDTAKLEKIPEGILTGNELEDWLLGYIHDHQGYERLLVYRNLKGFTERLTDQVKVAIEVCHRYSKSHRRWLRVFFLFDESSTWTWIREGGIELEDSVDAAVSPRLWESIGIRQRLTDLQKMETEEICNQIMRVTGGWPYLLDELFDRCQKDDDPRPYAAQIESELAEGESDLVSKFREALGITMDAIFQPLLTFVIREKEVPFDLVTPEFIEGAGRLSEQDCEKGIEFLRRMRCVVALGNSVTVEPVTAKALAKSWALT